MSRNTSLTGIGVKPDLNIIEDVEVRDTLLDNFPLIRDKTKEELQSLNKKVLKKLDWWFLPTVTAMLLMKYDNFSRAKQ